MLDIASEPLVPLRQVCDLLPPARGGRPTHPATVTRWILRGCRSVTGDRIRLEAVRCGARWLTSAAALSRFVERLSGPPAGDAAPPASRTPSSRQRASEAAARRLGESGA